MGQERRVSDHTVETVGWLVRPHRRTIPQRIANHHTDYLVGINAGPRGQDPAGGDHRSRIYVGPEQAPPHQGLAIGTTVLVEASGGGQQEHPSPAGRIDHRSPPDHVADEARRHVGGCEEGSTAPTVVSAL